jgi:hypothetical protein
VISSYLLNLQYRCQNPWHPGQSLGLDPDFEDSSFYGWINNEAMRSIDFSLLIAHHIYDDMVNIN